MEHLAPGVASVGGFENAALGVCAPGRSHGCDPNGIGVVAVHNNAVDVAGFFESHALPSFSAIEGAVDAGTGIVRVSRISFARSGPDDIGVGGVNGECPDGLFGHIVEEGFPGHPSGVRLPQST